MTVRNVRTGKDVRLTRAMKLFAAERESVEVAFAGDVVGLATRASSRSATRSPRVTRRRSSRSPPSSRNISPGAQYRHRDLQVVQKGIAQLREEGAIQCSTLRADPDRTILAAVGALQFEVVKYRLESEYNVKTIFQTSLHDRAARAWRERGRRNARLERAAGRRLDGNALAVFESEWSIGLAQQWNPACASEAFGARDLAEPPREPAHTAAPRGRATGLDDAAAPVRRGPAAPVVWAVFAVLSSRSCCGRAPAVNKYEKIAHQLSEAIQNGDVAAVQKLENSGTAADMPRERLGAQPTSSWRWGRSSASRRTPVERSGRVHEFDVTFAKGSVHEKIEFDPQDKVLHFRWTRSRRSDRIALRRDVDDVRSAAERLRGIAHRTRSSTSRTLDERTGARAYLKAENSSGWARSSSAAPTTGWHS